MFRTNILSFLIGASLVATVTTKKGKVLMNKTTEYLESKLDELIKENKDGITKGSTGEQETKV